VAFSSAKFDLSKLREVGGALPMPKGKETAALCKFLGHYFVIKIDRRRIKLDDTNMTTWIGKTASLNCKLR
jgi:hypothetical protein